MTSSLPCALAARSSRARAISAPTWLPCTAKGAKASLLTMNYGWIGRCWRRKNEPSEAAAQSSTLVLTLIPIVLSAMRISAVANGDRATLVTQLSALDVKSTLLGTFVWPLPTTFGVVAAMSWIRWVWLRAAPEPAASTFGWRSWRPSWRWSCLRSRQLMRAYVSLAVVIDEQMVTLRL